MFSRAGESVFIRDVVFPFIERAIDLAFVASALVAPLAVFAALAAFASGSAGAAVIALAVAGAAALGIHARFIAPWQLRVRHLSFDPGARAPAGLRVVFFTDLHLGRFKQAAWASRVVDAVNAQSPDVILVGGDYAGHLDRHSLQDLLAPLADLREDALKFAVLGNHDHGLPGTDRTVEIERILNGHGLRVLRNECCQVRGRLRVIGLDELWAKRARVVEAFASCAESQQADITVVLGHNPDVLLEVAPQDIPALERDAIWLFGHTHAGQIYLPFAPGLGVPITSRFYRGRFQTEYGSVYVSSGCGEAATPTRIGTRPEIVVFDL